MELIASSYATSNVIILVPVSNVMMRTMQNTFLFLHFEKKPRIKNFPSHDIVVGVYADKQCFDHDIF